MFIVFIAGCDSTHSAVPAAEPPAGLVAGSQLLQNGGFEEGGNPAPRGWIRDMDRTGGKGSVESERDDPRSGQAALVLKPTQRNDKENPLAIAQIIPAAAWRGKHVEFSGFLAAEGGATAMLGMLTIAGGKASNLVIEAEAGSAWTQHKRVYAVPDDPAVQLVLTLMVNGTGGQARFDDLSVVPLMAGTAPAPAPAAAARKEVQAASLKATAEVDTLQVIRDIPRTLFGTNVEWRWNATALWQEKEERADPHLTALTRDLGVTLIRFPGGVYSDFYHWKKAIGPRARRAELKHEPGKDDKSRPNFGTDEALAFAQSVGAELLITVNAGTGTAAEAADWVRYVNARQLRVRYWEVGNELYIKGGSPTNSATIDPQTYAARFIEFARAMRAADPRIKIGAIGGENQGRYRLVSYPEWNRIVLQNAGREIDFLAVHNSYAPVGPEERLDVRTVYEAMLAAPLLIRRNLETLERQISQYAPDRAGKIDVAVTEWGPFFDVQFNSRYIDHSKTLGAALFTASAMKQFIESRATRIANFWMLHDWSVLGAIGSRNASFPATPEWFPTARYYAFQLYTKHFGEKLITTTVKAPTYDSEPVGWIDSVDDVPFLEIISSLSADGQHLYVMAINKHFDSPIETVITLRGFQPEGTAVVWSLTGSGIDAHTGTQIIRVPGLRIPTQAEDASHRRFTSGSPAEISMTSSSFSRAGSDFTYVFEARSVTSLVLRRAR